MDQPVAAIHHLLSGPRASGFPGFLQAALSPAALQLLLENHWRNGANERIHPRLTCSLRHVPDSERLPSVPLLLRFFFFIVVVFWVFFIFHLSHCIAATATVMENDEADTCTSQAGG